jgi:hypothetical protein
MKAEAALPTVELLVVNVIHPLCNRLLVQPAMTAIIPTVKVKAATIEVD